MSPSELFEAWEKRASVRVSPRRMLHAMEGYHFFSPSVSPLLAHPLLNDWTVEKIQYLEVQLLYKYLTFTEYLETKLVNVEILNISNDVYQLGFTEKPRWMPIGFIVMRLTMPCRRWI